MRTRRRRILAVVTGLVAAGYVMSIPYAIKYNRGSRPEVGIMRGVIRIEWCERDLGERGWASGSTRTLMPPFLTPGKNDRRVMGTGPPPFDVALTVVWVPLWPLVLGMAGLTWWSFWRARRARVAHEAGPLVPPASTGPEPPLA